MSKNALRSPLKVLAATSVAIFSLLTVFTSTAAWFDSRRTLNNGANQMEVNVVGDLDTIDIYRPTTATVEEYVFGSTPIQTIHVKDWDSGMAVFEYKNAGDSSYSPYTTDAAVNMNPTITIGGESLPDPFSPLSPYHPLMMVFTYRSEVNAAQDKVKISAETSHNFLTPSKTPTGEALAAETILSAGNPLSSFIRTYSKGYDANTSVPLTYTASALEDSSMQKGSFATLNGNDVPTFNSSPVFYTKNTGNIKKVAVIFEYYIDVIEYIYSYHLTNAVLENTITTVCDWSLYV